MIQYSISKKLDLRSQYFPLTYEKAALALKPMESGDILQMRVSATELQDSLPDRLLTEGHQVVDIVKDGHSFLLFVMKGGMVRAKD